MATDLGPTTTHTQRVFDCPACGESVTGRLQLSLTLDKATPLGAEIAATAKITGLSVRHDCTPKVTRAAKS